MRRPTAEEAAATRRWRFFQGIVLIPAFVGLMVGSAGAAIFPDLAQLAAPFVCSGERLVTTTSHRAVGNNGSSEVIETSCVDAGGKRRNAPGIFIMLVIMGELFVPLAVVGAWVSSQVWPAREPDSDDD